MTSENVVEDL